MDVSALKTDHRTACSLHTEDPKTRLQPLFKWAACGSLEHCICGLSRVNSVPDKLHSHCSHRNS